MSRADRDLFTAYLRAQLGRSARPLPVRLSRPELGVIAALLEEFSRTRPGEDLGGLAGDLARALRNQLAP